MTKHLTLLGHRIFPILLFIGLAWGQKEYNEDSLILNGDRFTKKFSEEIVNGTVYRISEDTKILLGKMRNGKKYDRWVNWWDNGLKHSEGFFDLGKRYGEWIYYDSQGKRDSVVYYKNNKRDGLFSVWHKNGQKSHEGKYNEVGKDGLWIYWYESGEIKEKGNYTKGLKDGNWIKLRKNGKKEMEEVYDGGESINKTEYNFEGIEIINDVIIHTGYGTIYIRLFNGLAAKHVENFRLHAKNGYYDGTIFHRVIPGFMIQGGDFNTKGDNKSSYGAGGHAAKYYGIGNEDDSTSWNLPAEFNDIGHVRGIVSMARSNSPNSAGSQFFICTADAPHLNGDYTAFGKVTKGMDVVDKIVNVPRDSRDNPKKRVEITVEIISSLEKTIGLPIPRLDIDIPQEEAELSTFLDSTSYALGADLGTNLKKQEIELNYNIFMAGLTDAMLDGELVKLDQKKRSSIITSLQQRIKDKGIKKGETNLKKADEFLAKNKKNNPDIKETHTGLQYRLIREGIGDRPVATDRVKVHYLGKLIDGSEFDSSYERGNPIEFGLSQVIKGWTEGLQLMKVGAEYEFFIHPKMAYGSRPRPKIPENSVLIFKVELLDIIK